MFEVRGPLMASRMFDDATMKVSTFQKDLGLIADFAGSLDSPTPLLAITATYYRAAAAQGRSQQDTACVYEVLRQLTAPGT
jgi:3-hydroxyisobutyrate dehydrogenase-like beta-hydroxyacid dehydrogenase